MATKDLQRSADLSMQELVQKERQEWENSLKKILDTRFRHFSQDISSDIRTIRNEMHEVHAKTSALEHTVTTALQECNRAKQSVNQLEHTVNEIATTFEEKIDRIETALRRNNLNFFNIPRHGPGESSEQCVAAVLAVLDGAVRDKVWSRNDIVDAYRLGRYNDNRGRPPPIIVKFVTWADKMMVLTVGREELRKKEVTVAADLTDKQRETIQEHRRQGMHAYYKGSRLVVEEARSQQLDQRQRRGRRENSYNQRYNTGYSYDSRPRGQSMRSDQSQQAHSQSGFSGHPSPHEFRSNSNGANGNYNCKWDAQYPYWSSGDQQQYQQYQCQPFPDFWSMQQFPSLPPSRNTNLVTLNNDRHSDDTGRPITQTKNLDNVIDQREVVTKPHFICQDDDNDTLTEQMTEVRTVENDRDEDREREQDVTVQETTDDTDTPIPLENSAPHDEDRGETITQMENTEIQMDNETREDIPLSRTDTEHASNDKSDRQTDTTETADQLTRNTDPETATCIGQQSTEKGDTSIATHGTPSSATSTARGGPATRQRSASCTNTSAKRQATLHETTRKHAKQTNK